MEIPQGKMPFHPLSWISWNWEATAYIHLGTAWTGPRVLSAFRWGPLTGARQDFRPVLAPPWATLIILTEHLRKKTVTSPRGSPFLICVRKTEENYQNTTEKDIVQTTLGYRHNAHDRKPRVAGEPGEPSAEMTGDRNQPGRQRESGPFPASRKARFSWMAKGLMEPTTGDVKRIRKFLGRFKIYFHAGIL